MIATNEKEVKENKFPKLKLISILIFLFFDLVFIILSSINVERIGGVLIKTSTFRFVFIFIFYIIGFVLLFYYSVILIYILYKKKKNDISIEQISKILYRLDLLLFVGKVFTILDFICIFLFTPSFVLGKSMSPTYDDGDFTIATNLFFNIEDDDVIIFVSPDGDKDFYVKRVIAKPSDEVRIEKHGFEWVFIVNDEEKDNFEVGYPEELMNKYGSSFIVPKNKYFVMGDNRSNSNDSRSFGLIDKSSILGKVIIHF